MHCKSIAAFITVLFSQGLHLAALVHQFLVTKDPSVMVSTYSPRRVALGQAVLVHSCIPSSQEDLWSTLEAIDMLTMCTGKPGYIVC